MEHQKNKQIVLGLLAHVDAGKTTLSEGLLYLSGSIRKRGRVDHGNATLDFYQQEMQRGITIFSKQAYLPYNGNGYTLLDTPGHVDFSAEMERTLSVLDYALVVVSALDGVQAHTRTIWRLLQHYGLPCFLFVNKMDIAHEGSLQIMEKLQKELDEHCVCFDASDHWKEEAALCSEAALEQYMATGNIEEEMIASLIQERKLFPVFFGSALKMQGVEDLFAAMDRYTRMRAYPSTFGARVFKVNVDEQGNRLTHLKITGGMLRVKEKLYQDEKADQLRRYCGKNYELLQSASAGMICAVKGIRSLYPGEGLGFEKAQIEASLTPYMTYQLHPLANGDLTTLYMACKQLAQEDPQLHVHFDENSQQLHVQLMGEIQCEVLQQQLSERFHLKVAVDDGSVIYKETIMEPVEGVGHFEPLRHYAEVHLLLEPLPPGSGLQVDSRCSEEDLALSWQRLILTHVLEQEHPGVLGGFPITDLRITLLSGKAHLKHTEGGDFREAVYRAIRHGLRRGKSVLLEPYCDFRMEVPQDALGRAIFEIERIQGSFQLQEAKEGFARLSGCAPLSGMQLVAKELSSYTKGSGRLYYTFADYRPCQQAQSVLEKRGYDCDHDVDHPCGSIFCAHGAGFYVPWNEVEQHMHLPFSYQIKKTPSNTPIKRSNTKKVQSSLQEDEELQAIFDQTYKAKKQKVNHRESYERHEQQRLNKEANLPECLLVDGYNIIHDWEELSELAKQDLDAARHALIQIMCNYQGYRQCTLILVFDAYKVKEQGGSIQKVDNIYVVYTKSAQTADSYIEQATHQLAKAFRVSVATSDGLEQLIAIGQGAMRISARGFYEEVMREHQQGMRQASRYCESGFSQPLAALRQWKDKE